MNTNNDIIENNNDITNNIEKSSNDTNDLPANNSPSGQSNKSLLGSVGHLDDVCCENSSNWEILSDVNAENINHKLLNLSNRVDQLQVQLDVQKNIIDNQSTLIKELHTIIFFNLQNHIKNITMNTIFSPLKIHSTPKYVPNNNNNNNDAQCVSPINDKPKSKHLIKSLNVPIPSPRPDNDNNSFEL